MIQEMTHNHVVHGEVIRGKGTGTGVEVYTKAVQLNKL